MTGSLSTKAPSCPVDFYGRDTIENPVPAYRSFHELGPVIWMERHNIHAICGFKELTESLRNHQVFQSGKGVSINDDVNKLLVGSTLNSDPPDHDLTRSITFSPLTPKALNTVRETVQREAEAIVEKLTDQREFDAATELAPHVPLTVVRDLVGLGDHGKDNMLGGVARRLN